MKLNELCDMGFNFTDANFWIIAKGSENKLGMPLENTNDYKNTIGFKVKEEAYDIVLPKYLYHIFGHLYWGKFWQKNGLIYGTLNSKHLSIEDIENLELNV